ncbi:hypothetical protein CDAR_593011 [Caerostris darwini]|uniref:Uncharacterized protein n=1 Tax=Caerostris darwini TaxID=1538125 RepID=A0AAV4MA53_9ARAC|nr:hypothetical protein CDAR_593011 [Caerostris darwini]
MLTYTDQLSYSAVISPMRFAMITGISPATEGCAKATQCFLHHLHFLPYPLHGKNTLLDPVHLVCYHSQELKQLDKEWGKDLLLFSLTSQITVSNSLLGS